MRKIDKISSRKKFAKKAALHGEKLVNLAKKTRKKINPVLFEEYIQKKETIKENIFYMSIGEYEKKYYWTDLKFQTFIIISKDQLKINRIRCVENHSDDEVKEYTIESYLIKDLKQKQEIENSINSLVDPENHYYKGKRVNLRNNEMLYKLKIEKYHEPFQTFRSKLKNMALEHQ